MNAVGHLQPYPVPRPKNRTNYEGGLAYRIRQEHELSDREIALLRNAPGFAQRHADGGREPDLVPRVQPANMSQPVNKKVKSKRKQGKSSASLLAPAPNGGATSSSFPMTTVSLCTTGHDCIICQNPIFGAEVRAPCGHFYDISCINALFQAATRDESLYPPRCCCRVIPLDQVQKHLKQTLLVEFKLKAKEFGTLKRVYCAAPGCSRFLGPLSEASFKTYSCPSPTCSTKTCGNCRMKYESKHHCGPDAETERMLTMSRASGWTRCPGCAQMIELDAGCNHVTCRCKTDFCYICCARWKTCSCPVWDVRMWLNTVGSHAYAQMQYAIYEPLYNVFRFMGLGADPLANILRAAGFQLSRTPYQELMAACQSSAPFVYNRLSTRHTDIAPGATPLPFGTTTSRADAIAPAPYAETTALAHRAEAIVPAPRAKVIAPALHAKGVAPVPRAGTIASARDADAIATAPHGDTQLADDREFPNVVYSKDGVNTVNDQGSPHGEHFGRSQKASHKEDYGAPRVGHGCQHTAWKHRSGGGMCGVCTEYLPNYLYQCGECEILCCGRCRLHHL